MAAPKECGHCVPTWNLKNLYVTEVEDIGATTFRKLHISYLACIKDIKCVSDSTKMPKERIRLSNFSYDKIPPGHFDPNTTGGTHAVGIPNWNMEVTIPPTTLNLFPGPGEPRDTHWGTDFSDPVCCKADRPFDCCGEMKKALCDCIKRIYKTRRRGLGAPGGHQAHPEFKPTEAMLADCCYTGRFEVLVEIPEQISRLPDDQYDKALAAFLNFSIRTKNKIIKELMKDLKGIGEGGGLNIINMLVKCGYTDLRTGPYFDPDPEDPIYGGWSSLCRCVGPLHQLKCT